MKPLPLHEARKLFPFEDNFSPEEWEKARLSSLEGFPDAEGVLRSLQDVEEYMPYSDLISIQDRLSQVTWAPRPCYRHTETGTEVGYLQRVDNQLVFTVKEFVPRTHSHTPGTLTLRTWTD